MGRAARHPQGRQRIIRAGGTGCGVAANHRSGVRRFHRARGRLCKDQAGAGGGDGLPGLPGRSLQRKRRRHRREGGRGDALHRGACGTSKSGEENRAGHVRRSEGDHRCAAAGPDGGRNRGDL